MNNNFYEIPNDWYSDFNNPFMPNTMNDLTDPKEAFDRGNLFNNIYEPYKNYKYRSLKPTNKKEALLYNILMYNFALTELSLYLDINPNNQNMLNLYNNYLDSKQKLLTDYENAYGPLVIDSNNIATNNWNWLGAPWPWEGTK